MIIHNLNNHTEAFLDDVSAVMFEKLQRANLEDIIQFSRLNELTIDEILEFLRDLSKEQVLNSTKKIKPVTNQNKDNVNNEEFPDFYENLFSCGFLSSIHIDVTDKCNLRCKHCYHPFDKYNTGCSLSLAEIKKIVDESHELGVFRIVISGGEPFMRDDIFDILDYISNKNIVIDLYTNATMIDQRIVSQLTQYNINQLGISLYGAKKDTHESITQNKSYDATKQAIEVLLKNGFNVKLKTVLMEENFSEYKDLQKFAEELDCGIIFDTSLTPRLDSDKTPIAFVLTPEQFLTLCTDKSSAYYADKIRGIEPDMRPCNAGRYSLYFNHEKNIYPCVSLRIKLGDIHDSLRDIWHNNTWLNEWRKIKNKDFIGYGKHSFCKYCIEICAGIAQLENGNYMHCEKSDCFKACTLEKARGAM
jgi:MoaA/NifB/PqqE/SkfB family radical SAM enzyme